MSTGDMFNRPEGLKGLVAYDPDGEKIGGVEQVYLDDGSGRPEWVTVKTGLFGTKESFVPLAGARRDGDALHVAYAKSVVKDAPRLDAEEHLDATAERELYSHYGVDGVGKRTMRTPGPGGAAGSVDVPGNATGTDVHARFAGDEDALIRSEERLRVGTENEEVGRARLRKVVVTEDVTTTVPVSHEEVRVVREPIREGDRVRADIGEAETEVTLHAERPVVRKEAVPVERVRLETERVTEQKEVSDTVRKEEIRYDDATGKDERRRGEGGRGDRRR
ncbi:hypothetical protein GCM10010331_20390 [Streptomyces xanthochromogenes]|uniref:DUF2382 domain-containing protein n=1 Tax=Streptomyces TaxID=1883 RepID=UPI00142203E0|nr:MULTISPECIES: PRC and DUF2382 domain-containing protein [Streptomyces]GHB33307.1 hypothetical protein GCM10010331_20390 [Streptomyces xanthochromogenes]